MLPTRSKRSYTITRKKKERNIHTIYMLVNSKIHHKSKSNGGGGGVEVIVKRKNA